LLDWADTKLACDLNDHLGRGHRRFIWYRQKRFVAVDLRRVDAAHGIFLCVNCLLLRKMALKCTQTWTD